MSMTIYNFQIPVCPIRVKMKDFVKFEPLVTILNATACLATQEIFANVKVSLLNIKLTFIFQQICWQAFMITFEISKNQIFMVLGLYAKLATSGEAHFSCLAPVQHN